MDSPLRVSETRIERGTTALRIVKLILRKRRIMRSLEMQSQDADGVLTGIGRYFPRISCLAPGAPESIRPLVSSRALPSAFFLRADQPVRRTTLKRIAALVRAQRARQIPLLSGRKIQLNVQCVPEARIFAPEPEGEHMVIPRMPQRASPG